MVVYSVILRVMGVLWVKRIARFFAAGLWLAVSCGSAPALAEDAATALQRVLDGVPDATPTLDIAFVEATSRTLLNSGQVDFAAAIELDRPVSAQRLSYNELFAAPQGAPRFAIIVDVVEARADRRVVKLTGTPSTVFLGYGGAPLSVPPDDPARSAAGFVEQPPPTVSPLGQAQPVGQPIVLSYLYDLATIQARKRLTAYAYVVDRQAKTYVRTTIDAHQEERFEVAYRVSRLDPRRTMIESQFDDEQAVDDFSRGELLVPLSDVLREAIAGQAKRVSFKDGADLRRTVLAGQNKTLANLAANQFDARPLNDPRFDSVVVIYTGKRTLGSGFYITPDVVMTNWHVVEDASFVELKLYDGRETFGTVLGRDARLDVALVRVEHRGRPVAFYTGRTLDPGSEVQAIGHPQRFEFAITRGIVSAVRRHFSINLPKWAGEKVLYVQTDAPISPGNSGGPLFLGNRVVGMNTWARTDGQNLNFAVHYAELMTFLNEHLPGYAVNPANGDG